MNDGTNLVKDGTNLVNDGTNLVTEVGRSSLSNEGFAFFLHSGKGCMVVLSTVVSKIAGKV